MLGFMLADPRGAGLDFRRTCLARIGLIGLIIPRVVFWALFVLNSLKSALLLWGLMYQNGNNKQAKHLSSTNQACSVLAVLTHNCNSSPPSKFWSPLNSCQVIHNHLHYAKEAWAAPLSLFSASPVTSLGYSSLPGSPQAAFTLVSLHQNKPE